MDNGIGALRSMLEDLGEWDNTVVIFFSDNGGLASHGSVNRPFRGGKGDYWEGGVHVPAFFSGGFVASALARNKVQPYRYGHLAHITDIHATMLRLAGFWDNGDDSLDGVDLWESLVEKKSSAREEVVININSPNFAKSGAVRWGKYKLIRNPEPSENIIYSRVQSKLTDKGLVISEVRMAFSFLVLLTFGCVGSCKHWCGVPACVESCRSYWSSHFVFIIVESLSPGAADRSLRGPKLQLSEQHTIVSPV